MPLETPEKTPSTAPHRRVEAGRIRRSFVPLHGALSLGCEAAASKLFAYAVLDLLSGVFPVAVGWLTKLALDKLGTQAPANTLVALAVGLAFIGVVQALVPHVVQYLQAELERATGTLAQARLFTAVGRFVGIGPFEDPTFLDTLRLAKQSGRDAPGTVVRGVSGVVRAGVTIVGFIGSLLVLAPTMALFVLLSAVPVLVAEIVLSRRRADMIWRISPRERREFFFDELLSNVDAAKEVRLFGTGDYLLGRMQNERRAADAARRGVDRRELSTQSLLALLAALISGAGLVWAIHSALSGALTLGDVAIFIAAVAGVQNAVAQLAASTAQAHQALVLFGHYQDVITAEPDLERVDAPRPAPVLRRGVELRDVWFRYGPDQPWILQGVDLVIPQGQSLALVGLNGAGKSTLVKLLCRLYDPTRGAILWDGVDIREIDPDALRLRMSAVFQDFMHYDLTARENIALGDLNAMDTPERIVDAARKAGIDQTVSDLPLGYDTLVTRTFFAGAEEDEDETTTGVLLSGGQMQRLALARALVREQRDFLILDEPTSGLDAEAEYELHTRLREFHRGRTSLLISHRLGSVRDANLIVVLSEGRIIEKGDHPTLMAHGGAYARLFALQAAGYAGDSEHLQENELAAGKGTTS
ncbi:ABC transporter ATP-binding protein [Streptomyces werraensis]|uniref:ABC transporter ATP-binding protein n=1 Tax=Streptomyces werraensis TaxID=68284 RepID=UPI00380716A5